MTTDEHELTAEERLAALADVLAEGLVFLADNGALAELINSQPPPPNSDLTVIAPSAESGQQLP